MDQQRWRDDSRGEVTALIGDYVRFFEELSRELRRAAIRVDEAAISHLGYKAETFEQYRCLRDRLFPHCDSYVEDIHNGRPIAKMILTSPLGLGPSRSVAMVELMPPKDTPARLLGLEHVGFVLGEHFDQFLRANEDALTGRQDQGPHCQPAYVTFPSGRRAKFYDKSLRRVLELEGQEFARPPAGPVHSSRPQQLPKGADR